MGRLTVLMLLIFFVSSGCRMCGTDYDYCMPAVVDGGVRNGGALYRAGSILNGMSGNYDKYFTDPDCVNCEPDNSLNLIEYKDTGYNEVGRDNAAGSGNTSATPEDSTTSKGWQGTDSGTNIGIPTTLPPDNGNNGNNGNNNNKPKIDPEFTTPSLEELMKLTPPRPAKSPKNNTPPAPHAPPANNIQDNFTLDNLRQLDPSVNDPDVQEVKILKIEDTTLRRR
ncbi:MAG: hypothetical protein LBT09_06745 [Planctomycetaceae bacterium]|jgi:hypothetical protein|nr:hypothetical protein [Planctomycetaceae bacterium]